VQQQDAAQGLCVLYMCILCLFVAVFRLPWRGCQKWTLNLNNLECARKEIYLFHYSAFSSILKRIRH